jgi:Flp pilus assembly protein TadG
VRHRVRAEDGLAAVELTLLMPFVLAVLAFLVIAGRLSTTRADIAAASRDAARAASLAQTFPDAVAAATKTAESTLNDQEVTCRSLHVEVKDDTTFVPGGDVTVTLTCEVSLRDVALPGVPGSREVSATSVEVIDQYRSVG